MNKEVPSLEETLKGHLLAIEEALVAAKAQIARLQHQHSLAVAALGVIGVGYAPIDGLSVGYKKTIRHCILLALQVANGKSPKGYVLEQVFDAVVEYGKTMTKRSLSTQLYRLQTEHLAHRDKISKRWILTDLGAAELSRQETQ